VAARRAWAASRRPSRREARASNASWEEATTRRRIRRSAPL
jgi:hypothetical protein